MKKNTIYLLIVTLILVLGCSKKEESATQSSSAKSESPVLKPAINTLHKAENLNQATSDMALQQKQEIDAATE